MPRADGPVPGPDQRSGRPQVGAEVPGRSIPAVFLDGPRPYLVVRPIAASTSSLLVTCAVCRREGPVGIWLLQPLETRGLPRGWAPGPATGSGLAVCAACDPGWANRDEVAPEVARALRPRPSVAPTEQGLATPERRPDTPVGDR